jgi:hypothetical protein
MGSTPAPETIQLRVAGEVLHGEHRYICDDAATGHDLVVARYRTYVAHACPRPLRREGDKGIPDLHGLVVRVATRPGVVMGGMHERLSAQEHGGETALFTRHWRGARDCRRIRPPYRVPP